jgi:hypothetical protein
MGWKLRLDQGTRVFAIDAAQESHHLLQRGNLTVDVLQLVPHRRARVKQFESNAVVLSPSLQEHQHAHTATPYCVHFREVQNYDVGVCLGRNCIPQLESSLGADKSARALNNRHLTDFVDMYARHLSLQDF